MNLKKLFNRQIFEEKSISKDVQNAALDLKTKILLSINRNVFNKNVKHSEISNASYVEGQFKYNLENFGDLKTINVKYVIYFFSDINEYNHFLYRTSDDESRNSMSDYATKQLTIVSSIVSGTFSDSFYGEIYHELTHLYQYSQGAQKDETLYDKVIKLYNQGIKEDNIDKQYVALNVYYSFKTEQDAMAHQFYATLVNLQTKGPFANVIYRYSEYNNALNAYQYVLNNKFKCLNYIHQLGFSEKDYFKHTRQALCRFYQKSKNAYDKYHYDYKMLDESVNSETYYKKNCEKWGFSLPRTIEFIYNYN